MDLTFKFGNFDSCSCDISAHTDKGKEFLGTMFTKCAGINPIGVNVPKTKGYDLSVFAERKGLTIERSE